MRSLLALAVLAALAAGCSGTNVQSGIENRWRAPGARYVAGQTTLDEVLRDLGPPSQIVPLEKGSIYFYVLQKTDTFGVWAVLFRTTSTDVTYDRALFQFDEHERLVRHSMSAQSIEYEAP